MGSINYITTIVNMRAPGMTYFRMPLTVWSLFITAILLLLALPVLTAALAMLLFDRTLGNQLLFAGRRRRRCSGSICSGSLYPEVYVLVLPAMGVTSSCCRLFPASRFSAITPFLHDRHRLSLVDRLGPPHVHQRHEPLLGTAFMMTTMVIAVPSAIKTFNWLGTLWGGSIRFTSPMLFALGFVSNFSSAA